MLKINPNNPNIFLAENGQRFAVYITRNTGKYIPRFYVSDYSHVQRSYKSYKTRDEAIKAAYEVCSKLPAKDVGKHKKIWELFYGAPPSLSIDKNGNVVFNNLKIKKTNKKSIITIDDFGNEYLLQMKPHRGGYTSGPRVLIHQSKDAA